MDFYTIQLECVRALQQIRNPFLDGFFKFFIFFDRQEFIFVLIPAIWFGYNWKAGMRLFYLLVLGGLVNYALKHFFACPRPFHLDPTLAVIQVGGYGFPSGAAQTALLLPGLLLNYYRTKWSWIVAINFFFWLSLSRVYLGVHFPIDILGGWFVGAALWALFTFVRPSLEAYLHTLKLKSLFLLSQAIPLVILFFSKGYVLGFCASAMGVGFGVFFSCSHHFFLPSTKNWKRMLQRALVGIAGMFIVYALFACLPFSSLQRWFQFYFLGIWLSLGGIWLCRTIKV